MTHSLRLQTLNFNNWNNKKVLLRERKRHTARRVVSTPSVVLPGYPPGGGTRTPPPGGLPGPPQGGTQSGTSPWGGTRTPPGGVPGQVPLPPWGKGGSGYPPGGVPSQVPPNPGGVPWPPRVLLLLSYLGTPRGVPGPPPGGTQTPRGVPSQVPPQGGSGYPPGGVPGQVPPGGYPDPPGGVPSQVPPQGGPGTPPGGYPDPPRGGYPDPPGGTRSGTPPWGGYLVRYPPAAPWHSGKCCKALWDMGTPPCGQTDGWMEGQTLVKTLPSLTDIGRLIDTTCSVPWTRLCTSGTTLWLYGGWHVYNLHGKKLTL